LKKELRLRKYCQRTIITVFSDVAMETLREYQEKYKLGNWLFMGITPEKHISTRTVQAIFEHACKKIRITKSEFCI